MNKKKTTSTWIVLGTIVAALAIGCATAGEIPVELTQPDTIYISPANQDGIQDTVSIEATVIPLEKTVLKRYTVTVFDSENNPVRTLEQSVPTRGRRTRRAAVDVPSLVLWDGSNDAGEWVADGEYRLVLRVWDNKENTGQGPDQRIVVDNTPPFAEVSSAYTLSTPNGDGRLDTLIVYQRRSTWEAAWTGQFIDDGGTAVRTLRWEGVAPDFAWDGKNDAGAVAADGAYRYVLSSTDEAGNSATFEFTGIALDTEPTPITVAISGTTFSPNGDGLSDTIRITPTLRVTSNANSWTLVINDVRGDGRRNLRGTGVPAAFTFDGRGDDGVVLPDGAYRAVMRVSYAGGQEPESASPPFTIDTRKPQASVTPSTLIFSPDGDGRKDTVSFIQTSSMETSWQGSIVDSTAKPVRRFSWQGTAADFAWDGRDDARNLAPDGLYTYRITATDEAENTGVSEIGGIRIDTRPTPVTITAAAPRFSPNGDGVQDVLPADLKLTVADGVESWEASVIDSTGKVLGTFASDGVRVPARVQWDGQMGGARAAEGSYTAALKVTYVKGNVSEAKSTAFLLDVSPPQISATVAPRPFSPDGDGVADRLTVTLQIQDASPLEGWRVRILDPTGILFTEFSGKGAPTAPITWDGRSPSGELVQAATNYKLVVNATDAAFNVGQKEDVIPVDVLVMSEGDRLRISISSIYFVPNKADYKSLPPEQVKSNLQTLDRLAEVLKKYPQYDIRIEGYAVIVYWNVPARAEVEQVKVLLPLSEQRAAVIKTALVERGIAADRMTTVGYGGLRPVVPHGDLENRWKNRRVEFILEKTK